MDAERQPKRCARCGAGFGCGAAGPHPCWCAALPAVPPLAGVADCVCPACLAALAAHTHSAASRSAPPATTPSYAKR